jgi:hypothetical protein
MYCNNVGIEFTDFGIVTTVIQTINCLPSKALSNFPSLSQVALVRSIYIAFRVLTQATDVMHEGNF